MPDGTQVDLPAATTVVRSSLIGSFVQTIPGSPGTSSTVSGIGCLVLASFTEPDDIRHDNPPTNQELLAVLQRELVESDFDLKHIYRLILNRRPINEAVYPRRITRRRKRTRPLPVRRLDAEVLIDAVCQITGTTESYSSLIPEPWTFIPGSDGSICLADGSITSPFLELFGRPAQNTGYESERGNTPSAAQKLHLLNSSHIRCKIEASVAVMPDTKTGRRGSRRGRSGAMQSAHETITDLYLRVLSRYPTEPELAAISKYHLRPRHKAPKG